MMKTSRSASSHFIRDFKEFLGNPPEKYLTKEIYDWVFFSRFKPSFHCHISGG